MMTLNAAPGLNARTSFLALLLAALQGLVPADPSLNPPLQASSDTDNLFPGMGTLGMSSESDSQARRTRDRNTLSSALLDREGRPVPVSYLQLRLEGAGTPAVSGQGPAAPSLLPLERAPGSRARTSRRRRRRRRSEALDSSDPLCLHTQRGECSLDQEEPPPPRPEADPPEHAHAVSKETIASTSDDPLNVVQPPEGAGSPRSVATDKALTKKRTAAEEKEVQA